MRRAFTNAFRSETQDQLRARSQRYVNYANSHGSYRDKQIGLLLKTVADNFDSTNAKDSFEPTNLSLTPYLKSDDWFVQLWALAIKWEMDIGQRNINMALQSAQEALKLVPEEDSSFAKEGRIMALDGISYLYHLMRNPQLGLEASRKSIDLQIEFGTPIDGISVVTNLIYSFNVWREHETSKQLLEILMRLEEKTQSGVPGLTDMRAAQIYNELGNYEQALVHAERSLNRTNIPAIQELASINRIIGLIGLGRIIEGEKLLEEYLLKQKEGALVSKRTPLRILYAQALIAMKTGDSTQAINLLNQRLDETVQYNLAISNSDTASMLASLQNSKERQEERENALRRETELQQLALTRQKRVNNLLIVLAVILTVVTVLAFAFARYRSRIAQKMSEAADKARAGEKAKSEFLAVMSHELRTPLNGILGLSDFLSRTAPSEDLRAQNKIIYKSGQDLLSLVENILDMTLIEGGDIKPEAEETDIRELLKQQETKWREALQGKDDIVFTTFVDPAVPQYLGLDPRRTRQCIDNLLSNAVKFTMAGRIHMHVTVEELIGSDNSNLTVIIADTGTGISEDAQTRLFKPFVQADSSMTRHYGGAGLGLAIARSLARLMGGDITVVSRENRGSEFTLTLQGTPCRPLDQIAPQPLSRPHINIPQSPDDIPAKVSTDLVQLPPAAASSSTGDPEPGSVISLENLNVLVVEDDIPNQDVLRAILGPTLCRVDCAEDGHMALIKLAQKTYHLVLMDIRMPGMDGVTTVKRIRQSREAHNHIPIIAVTADVSSETNIKCMAAGVDIFLTKPVRARELLDAISYVTQQEEGRQTA